MKAILKKAHVESLNELMHEDGRRLTKKEYGKVLIKYLVKELMDHYC